jgi:hypothetical protein
MPASTLAIEPLPPTGVPGGTSNCLLDEAGLRLSIVRKEAAIIRTDRNLYFGLGAAEDRNRLVCAMVVLLHRFD